MYVLTAPDRDRTDINTDQFFLLASEEYTKKNFHIIYIYIHMLQPYVTYICIYVHTHTHIHTICLGERGFESEFRVAQPGFELEEIMVHTRRRP